MTFDRAGRIALVTGADSGIGKETARLLLEEGVRGVRGDQPGGKRDERNQCPCTPSA